MKNKDTNDIEQIISNSKKELEQMPYYTSFNEQYNELSKSFKEGLTDMQKNAFEELMSLFCNIKNYESYIVYRVGYENGFKHKNNENIAPENE